MASRKAVVTALKLLACNFAGDVDEERIQVWHAALADIEDAALREAVPRIIRERTQDFLPPVAVVREACRPAKVFDAERILTAIDKAGSHDPVIGWCHPRIEKIRAQFGHAVADAFGMAGGASRLYADDPVTRDIAAREFAQALRDSPHPLVALPSPEKPKQLEAQTDD